MATDLKERAVDYMASRYLEKAQLFNSLYHQAVAAKRHDIARKAHAQRARAERYLEQLLTTTV